MTKPRPNRRLYIEALRRMSPDARLRKAFELTELARALFLDGLRRRFPDRTEEEIRKIYLARLAKCHSRSF